jgi:hypothetical protein
METLSQKFLEALAPPRDALYRLALLRAANAAGAEAVLRESACGVFREYAGEKVGDIPAAVEKLLTPAGAAAPAADLAPEGTAMPADVWSRLAAAVQIEAARSSNSRALNPDSVLLRPDPLLAPKKARPREADDFDVSSPSRLLMLLGAALLIGIVVTAYIMTRPAAVPAASQPVTRPGHP